MVETHRQIFERCKDQEGVCVTCGNELPDDPSMWDDGHVLNPRSKGGDETWPQCFECNARQGNQTLDEWDENGDIGVVNKDPLRALVDLRRALQKQQFVLNNRHIAGKKLDTPDQFTEKYLEKIAGLVDAVDDDIRGHVRFIKSNRPIFVYVMEVKGISEVMAAQLIAHIADIRRSPHISSLWKFAGYAPGFDKPVKGQRRPFNLNLRTVLYKTASQFLKCGSPYRRIYDERKTKMKALHPDYKPARLHNDAIRIMMKVFLSHLWVTWRSLDGLPITKPYVNDHLGHEHYHKPEDFGWRPISRPWSETQNSSASQEGREIQADCASQRKSETQLSSAPQPELRVVKAINENDHLRSTTLYEYESH
jgi:hypothetical protein